MHRHNVSCWYWVYELALSAAGADEFGVERHMCSLTSYTVSDHPFRCSVREVISCVFAASSLGL